MGDRVAVMRKGELQQVDEPQSSTTGRSTSSSAGFIGSPRDEHGRGDGRARERRRSRSTLGDQQLELDDEALARARPALALRGPRRDPRHPPRGPRGRVARADAPRRPPAARRVELREALGSELIVHFTRRAARGADRGGQGAGRGPRRATGRAPALEGRRRRTRSLVGRFGAAARGRGRETRSRSRSTRARCTSSTRRRARDLRRKRKQKGASA